MSKDIASEVYDRAAANASSVRSRVGPNSRIELGPFSWKAARTAAIVHSLLVIAFAISLYLLDRGESQIVDHWVLWVIIDGPAGLIFLATHSPARNLLHVQSALGINLLCAVQFIVLGSTQYAIIFGSLCRKSIERQQQKMSNGEAKENVRRDWVVDSENPYSAPQAGT